MNEISDRIQGFKKFGLLGCLNNVNEVDGLSPCPFCNSNNLRIPKLPLISNDFKDFTMYESHVECLDCGSDGPKRAYVGDVKKAWNERKVED